MQKLITSLVLSIYILGSLEVVINVHYCFGEMKSISLYDWDSQSCCEKFLPKAPCCDDQQITFSVEEEQQISSSLIIPVPVVEPVQGDKTPLPATIQSREALHPDSHAPPPLPSKPWILFQRLIWYG
ncbi:MAG: hypothetical protein AAFV07_04040 [Bacteroidota bacterium]